MNVNKPIAMLLLFFSFFSFSQKKVDVYFLMDNNDPKYVLSTSKGEFNADAPFLENDNIFLFFRKQFEERKKRITKEKKEGTYYGITSNENYPKLPSLDFSVKSKSQTELSACSIKELTLIDFEWLNKNSWVQPDQKMIPFKNIYFLCKTNGNNYIKFKVERTVIAH